MPGLSIRASQLQRPGAFPLPPPYWEVPPPTPLPHPYHYPGPSPFGQLFLMEMKWISWQHLYRNLTQREGSGMYRGHQLSWGNLWEICLSIVLPFPLYSQCANVSSDLRETLLVPLQGHSFVPVLGFMSPPAATLDLGWDWEGFAK